MNSSEISPRNFFFFGYFILSDAFSVRPALSSVYLVHIRNIGSGPGSSVNIATGSGLDGPGIESRWGRDFPHLSRPALGPTQPPVQ